MNERRSPASEMPAETAGDLGMSRNGPLSSMHSARRIRILCAVTDRGYCWFGRASKARKARKPRPLFNPETLLSGRMNQEDR